MPFLPFDCVICSPAPVALSIPVGGTEVLDLM
jgi:hypothetical protein